MNFLSFPGCDVVDFKDLRIKKLITIYSISLERFPAYNTINTTMEIHTKLQAISRVLPVEKTIPGKIYTMLYLCE